MCWAKTLRAYPDHGSAYLRYHDSLTYCIICSNNQTILLALVQCFESFPLSQHDWSVDLTCLHGLDDTVYTAESHGTLCPVLSTFVLRCRLLMWVTALEAPDSSCFLEFAGFMSVKRWVWTWEHFLLCTETSVLFFLFFGLLKPVVKLEEYISLTIWVQV